jgi:dienelactone hydrolase
MSCRAPGDAHREADPLRSRRAAVLLAFTLLATGCQPSGGRTGPVPSPLPLGTVSPGPANGPCLPGDECRGFEVTCPGIALPAKGAIDVGRPIGTPRGVLVFFSGGGGSKLWALSAEEDTQFVGGSRSGGPTDQEAARLATAFLSNLRAAGFVTVMVRWQLGWPLAAPGEAVGPARLACRAASVIQWVHETLYRPIGIHRTSLVCGFCLTGNSAGGSAIAYALAFYPTAPFIDAVVLSGGPPHAAIAEGCLGATGFAYPGNAPNLIDASYGFASGTGPCTRHDTDWRDRWARDSIDSGGGNYEYPATRILLLLGAEDTSGVGAHQERYLERLREAGDPHVDRVTVPAMTHAVTASAEGLRLIGNSFLQGEAEQVASILS